MTRAVVVCVALVLMTFAGACGQKTPTTSSADGNEPQLRALGATVRRFEKHLEPKFTHADKVSGGLFDGCDRRVYELHKAGKTPFDMVTTVFCKGPNIYKVRIERPWEQLMGLPYMMWQLGSFVPLYVAATNADFRRTLNQTVIGRVGAKVEGRKAPGAGLWEVPSIEWSKQCAALVDDRAIGTRTVNIEGFTFSCRTGPVVRIEVISEDAPQE